MDTTNKLINLGLQRVTSLEEVLEHKGFFLIDESLAYANHFHAMPITKKANLTHDMLNLYGTHWRYRIANDTLLPIIIDGDREAILKETANGKVAQRFASFAYTKNALDNLHHLWLFTPQTTGWHYLQNTLLPLYKQDQRAYKRQKQRSKRIMIA